MSLMPDFEKTWRFVFCLVLSSSLASCGSSAPFEFDPDEWGVAACPESIIDKCEELADRTVMSLGPRQIEYHSPEGRTRIWVGSSIYDGYWRLRAPSLMNFGISAYYVYVDRRGRAYQTSSVPTSRKFSERAKGVYWVDGDPLELTNRRIPPTDTKEFRRATLQEIVDQYASTPQR